MLLLNKCITSKNPFKHLHLFLAKSGTGRDDPERNGISGLCCMGLLKTDLRVHVYMQSKTFCKGRDQNAIYSYLAQWDYGKLIFFLLFNLNFLIFFYSEIALLEYLKTG